MSELRKAAQQAFEVLLEYQPNPCLIPETQEETDRAEAFWDAIDALRAALAEPEQNPFSEDAERYARKLHEEREYYKALFTAPTPRKPLTDEAILSVLRLTPPEPSLWPHLKDETVVGDVQKAVIAIARAIEHAHGITGDSNE